MDIVVEASIQLRNPRVIACFPRFSEICLWRKPSGYPTT
jgi:hypothetical protein